MEGDADRIGSAILGTDDNDRMPCVLPASSIIAIAFSAGRQKLVGAMAAHAGNAGWAASIAAVVSA